MTGGVAITGVGMTPFVRQSPLPARTLAAQAAREAIEDAGVDARQIDAVFVGSVRQGSGFAQRMLLELGLTGIAATNVENACSSGSTALHLGHLAVGSGEYETVLVVGAEVLSGAGGGPLELDAEDRHAAPALTFPAWYALDASRLLQAGAIKLDDLADVSVKNRRHGALNPYAQFRDTITREQVLASRMIAEPLTLLQCCPTSDGAAAVVLQPVRRAAPHAPRLRAVSLVSGNPHGSSPKITARAAERAYARAGVGPEDVDVAEVHDAFSVAELMHYEGLGFAAPGEAARLLRDGDTTLGGRLPVSPSGGLLARGHPLGATGVAQIVELTWQLRGQAGARQVEGARVALAHTAGGGVVDLEAIATCVAILTA